MHTGHMFNIVDLAVGEGKLQDFVDRTKEVYNKLEIDGFAFSPHMQMGLTFEQASKQYGMNAMATVVDIDSFGTPITTEGEIVQTGKIPTLRKQASYGAEDFRKLALKAAIYDKKVLAEDTLLDTTKKLTDPFTNSLTYFRHQLVSTHTLTLTEVNNKGGITGAIFKANIPEENVKTLSSGNVWWTQDGTEGSNSDPVKDLKALVRQAKAKGGSFHFEVDALTLEKTLNHSKVIEAVGFTVNTSLVVDAETAVALGNNLFEEERKARLEKLIGVPIKAIDSISRVDTFNRDTMSIEGVEMRSFDEKTWALVPDGKIGEIVTAVPISVDNAAARTATYYGGRLLITEITDPKYKTQEFLAEMHPIAVPVVPQLMYRLVTG